MEPTYKFISPIKCYSKYFNTKYEDNIESAFLCILNNAYKVCSLHIGDCIVLFGNERMCTQIHISVIKTKEIESKLTFYSDICSYYPT